MVGYVNSIKDRQYKLCTPDVFEQLTNSPMVAQLIEDYRKGNEKAKSLLPSFMFQGYDPNVLLGKTGSRLAKNLKPTGLFILDFDHVDDPYKLYDIFLKKVGRKPVLAHITPSGKGLRIVDVLPDGMTIEEAQAEVAAKMETKMDGVVKDLSRLSFCPMASDILYINKVLLFGEIKHTDFTDSTDNAFCLEHVEEKSVKSVESVCKTFPETYSGIPYKRIVEELIMLHGGEPQVGNRENTVFRLASDLAKITDRSAPWLESLIPTFGQPEEEWRTTIAQVCKKPIETGISRKLQDAIKRCEQIQTTPSRDDSFPQNAPALIRLLTSRCMPHMRAALSQMLFPALAAHVSNAKFMMGDNSTQELGLMAVLVGKQSTGKSCIDKPIHLITADIAETDRINMERLRQYNEKRKNRKASERGESRPQDIIIRCIGGNVTNPALLQLLVAAETGNPDKPNQCLYSEVTEIQRLYKMGTDGSKLGVADLIKAAFDRANLDAFRATTDAVTAITPARWNFSAATTPEGADKFFSGSLLTDGTLSRIAFCYLPDVDIPTNEFSLGNYDETFVEELKVFIDNLNNYRHPTDDQGKPVPLFVPEANELRRKVNELIDFERGVYPDSDTYTAYAFRTRDIVIRQAITTWIANGCKWEDCDDYWLWAYSSQMDTKMSIFGEKAAEKFEAEKPKGHGQWTPLREMKRTFTYTEFADVCAKAKVKMTKTPARLLSQYKYKGFVTQDGDKYVMSDEICKRYNIT